MVESKSRPGTFYGVHLTGVIADKIEVLGNNGHPTHPNFATHRVVTQIQRRQEKRAWSKP